jgi:beta-1,4-mannosyl-glycoprotein beta-1,4-N-acetylglucosaminyltransferase
VLYIIMKIIDSFTFCNELDLLEFRLNELYDVVDHFVLVEAPITFSGKHKPLYYEDNKEKYAAYNDKIVHIVVNNTPDTDDPWIREHFQRECQIRGFMKLNLKKEDIIVSSDLDEIIDNNTLKIIRENGLSGIYKLNQEMYYYNLNCKANKIWDRAMIFNYGSLGYKSLANLRNTSWGLPALEYKGGWHFSYFGNVDFIIKKIEQNSHQEYNTDHYKDKNRITKIIENCGDLYGRDNGIQKTGPHEFHFVALKDNKYLPKNYILLLDESVK